MEWVIDQSDRRHESASELLEEGHQRRRAHGPYRYALRRSLPIALPIALITGTILFWAPRQVQHTEISWSDLESQSVFRLIMPTVLILCFAQGLFMYRRSVKARKVGELHPPLLFGRREPSFKRGLFALFLLAISWTVCLVIFIRILSAIFPQATVSPYIAWGIKMVVSLFVVLSIVIVAARIAIHDADDHTQPTPLA